MPPEEREEFFRSVIEDDSSSDETVLCEVENIDEDELSDALPNEKYVASDAETEEVEVGINEESDSDEESESEDDVLSADDEFFENKDGVKWRKRPPLLHRHRTQNILRERNFIGPKPTTKNLTRLETFNCIFSSDIRNIIIGNSNEKAEAAYTEWNANNPDEQPRQWKPITDEELSGFLGILIVMGCHQSSKEQLTELWKNCAYPLYRATMARDRFKEILQFLRFDSSTTRAERRATDKAAPIREVFEKIISNLDSQYRPHESITVDEQLFNFRGRTPFTQYMPSKPAKYGIKIWWVCDSFSYYPLRGQLYTGKVNNTRDVNQGERVVKDLVSGYKGSGRNVTTDNFFTTLPLAKELQKWSLSIVGTVKKNKRYVPNEFKPSSVREVKSSLFGFADNVTLCSYVPAKKKSVVLLSTMHNDNTVSGPDNKPEIILYYNKTKGGVDTMDKMLSQYSTKRATYRWPLALFFNLLDTAALAAFIIFEENNLITSLKRSERKKFLETLGEELCRPLILSRSKKTHVTKHFHVRSAIECLLGNYFTILYLLHFTIY